MQSLCLKEASQECLLGCCQKPFLNLSGSGNTITKPRTTFATSRLDFAETTSSSIFPNTRFTNHESLPSLKESFIQFIKAYPQYSDTHQVDTIRAQEYYHLSQNNHICLDYIGIGLFSYSQSQEQDTYGKQLVCASSSSLTALPPQPSSPPIPSLDIPFFSVSYKTVNLKAQLLHGGRESELESAMKKRIMGFLNISENDYTMVFTTNRTSAFKLVANSYPFKTSQKLLTVYDYESEAVEAMIQSSDKRGAKVLSADFSWPGLRIQSSKLRKMLESKRKKKKRGLFVFPLHSRITGARYPYLWMSVAHENGWHVLFDACALGSKDMDSFGFSLFQPNFLICSFYKVFGENPCGFGCLFIKKSSISILESSTSTGIVNIMPANEPLEFAGESSGTDTELKQTSYFGSEQTELDSLRLEKRESSDIQNALVTARLEKSEVPETGKSVTNDDFGHSEYKNGKVEVECRALDQVDSLRLVMITNRSRYLINWIVSSLMKLEHPTTEGTPLVRIYGPKIKFDRGPALAFNVYDWKGEKVEPVLVQKLADRSNISLSYGFLNHIWFSDKYADEKGRVLERRDIGAKRTTGNILKDNSYVGITVVTAAFGFLSNFEDAYRFWAFVAQFLDADFVEKERWRYTSLNQKTIEILI